MGRKKGATKDDEKSLIYRLFDGVILSLTREVKSLPGRINMLFDVLMALILIVYLLSGGIREIALVVSSIWNPELTKYNDDSTTVILVLSFICFSALCLVLMYVIDLNEKRIKTYTDDIN